MWTKTTLKGILFEGYKGDWTGIERHEKRQQYTVFLGTQANICQAADCLAFFCQSGNKIGKYNLLKAV